MMWTRTLLKNNAKTALQGKYLKGVLVCLLSAFLSSTSGSSYASYNTQIIDSRNHYSGDYVFYRYGFGTFFLTLIVACIIIAIALLISSAIETGRSRYFMEARVGNAPFSTLFSTFRTPGYWNIVKTMFFRSVSIFLWSLLLIIPGIIKSFEYHLVPYILAENPSIPTSRALELSREMMRGEKLQLFILGLSFFGWYILCAFTFGIGFIFLAPYISATYAEFYAAMRAKALASGLSNETELGDFVRY